jgi:hypothetical protein
MFKFEIDDEGINLYDLLANCERILETTVRSGNWMKYFLIETFILKVILGL